MRTTPLLLVLALAACSKPAAPSQSTGPANPMLEAATYAPALAVDLNSMTRSSSGLYVRDITAGSGPAVAIGNNVTVKYAGYLANGQRFDEGTYSLQIPGRVITGWNEGLVGMRVGGKRQLVIPPSLGYGASGNGPIPPDAILVFNIELVAMQ
jgi:FKBP-type peptidyl-prolyl cis-trans isomerase